jgi:hypothetical protein
MSSCSVLVGVSSVWAVPCRFAIVGTAVASVGGMGCVRWRLLCAGARVRQEMLLLSRKQGIAFVLSSLFCTQLPLQIS